MKKKLRVLIFLLLTGMILGTTQPAQVYASETGQGNIWDPFINISLFTGKPISSKHVPFPPGMTLAGRLSIAFEGAWDDTESCASTTGNYQASMFYTVTLSDGHGEGPWLYTSFTPGVCLGDVGGYGTGGQADVIIKFLKTVVLQIFPNAKDAYLKSVSNPWYALDGFSFAADITIAVKK